MQSIGKLSHTLNGQHITIDERAVILVTYGWGWWQAQCPWWQSATWLSAHVQSAAVVHWPACLLQWHKIICCFFPNTKLDKEQCNYCDILNMWLIIFSKRLINVNIRVIYVNMRLRYVNMRRMYVNIQHKPTCWHNYLIFGHNSAACRNKYLHIIFTLGRSDGAVGKSRMIAGKRCSNPAATDLSRKNRSRQRSVIGVSVIGPRRLPL